MLTVIAEVENPAADIEEEVKETSVNHVSTTLATKECESVPAVEENFDISLSELKQVLPKLPPKLSHVPPKPPLSRSKLTFSQSFSAVPPQRPPAMLPRPVHRAQSSTASHGLPPVPPRAPRTAATIHSNPQSTLSSLQQPATTTNSSSGIIIPSPSSLFSHPSPDSGALGTTFNYVYFTEDAEPPPPPPQLLAKSKKPARYHPDMSLLGGSRHADIGKKLADSGLGSVNAASYGSSADNYDSTAGGGSYVRLAVTTPPPAIDPTSLHDYCYPSIDAIVPAPTASVCRTEPQHSPPPLPMKSCRVWWDCRWRRQRAPRRSQLRATWSPRSSTTYGTEPSVVTSHLSLNNSQSSSLNTRRAVPAWRARLLCFVRTCMHPCRWQRRRQLRRSSLARVHTTAITGHL